MDTFYSNWKKGNHISNQKKKYNKPNVRMNIWMKAISTQW
jgi:hypothetical protein